MKKIKLFLDSGAWSAYTQKKTIDIDAYIQFIKKYEHLIEVYANLDVINDGKGSYLNYRYMKDQGLNPLPVYHAETDERYLRYYLKHSDYIAIGAIAKMTTKYRIANLDSIFEKYLLGSPIKVHGFGVTSLQIMFRYPWHSLDSTSWVAFSKFGSILIPTTLKMKHRYNCPPRVISLSIRSPSNKKFGQNINTTTPILKKTITRYIKSQGFELGESKIISEEGQKIKEEVISPGVSNNHKLRDQFNFLFYVHAEQDNNLRIYMAGNFPLMKSKEGEKAMRDKVYTTSDFYRRLISYYYEKDIMNLIELKQEEMNGP